MHKVMTLPQLRGHWLSTWWRMHRTLSQACLLQIKRPVALTIQRLQGSYGLSSIQQARSELFPNCFQHFHIQQLLTIGRTYNNIKAGVKACTAKLIPQFLFPNGQIYDPEDIEAGVFQGHLLPRVSHLKFQWTRLISYSFYSDCQGHPSWPFYCSERAWSKLGPQQCCIGDQSNKHDARSHHLLSMSGKIYFFLQYLVLNGATGKVCSLLPGLLGRDRGVFWLWWFFWDLYSMLKVEEEADVLKTFNQYIFQAHHHNSEDMNLTHHDL